METIRTPLSTEVTITRKIEKGRRFRISASQGFLGIEEGVVEVMGVHTYDDATLLAQYVKGGLPDIDAIVECDSNTVEQLWVVYQYTQPNSCKGDMYCFTVDIFGDHISGW